MHRFQQAKKKFGQITWLMLGLCFVLLYSCPVKKFLILYFEKPHGEESASAQFMKAHAAQSVKIAYLHRDSTAYTIGSTERPAFPHPRPNLPACAAATTGNSNPGTSLPSGGQSATFSGDLPRYLQLLRLRI
jgi:hypothetical protein